VAASLDGRLLATGSQEGVVRLWDASSGALLRSFSATDKRVFGLAFSPDGRRLASTGGNLVKVWDLSRESSDPVVMSGHTLEVIDVGFSPDGTRIATASRDGTGAIWDTASGQRLVQLTGHASTIVLAVFSPDGRHVATASRDGTARLWSSTTGAEELILHGSDGGLNGVAFSPDGTRLATGGEFGMRLYVLPIDQLVNLAHERLTLRWTLDECQRYLHMDQCPSG
jgi:WD40 repeat protein